MRVKQIRNTRINMMGRKTSDHKKSTIRQRWRTRQRDIET